MGGFGGLTSSSPLFSLPFHSPATLFSLLRASVCMTSRRPPLLSVHGGAGSSTSLVDVSDTSHLRLHYGSVRAPSRARPPNPAPEKPLRAQLEWLPAGTRSQRHSPVSGGSARRQDPRRALLRDQRPRVRAFGLPTCARPRRSEPSFVSYIHKSGGCGVWAPEPRLWRPLSLSSTAQRLVM